MKETEVLLLGYPDRLVAYVVLLEKEGFLPLRRKLEEVLALLSCPVQVSGGQQAEGIAKGIRDPGELLVRLEDDTLLPVTCGDVSVRGVNKYA